MIPASLLASSALSLLVIFAMLGVAWLAAKKLRGLPGAQSRAAINLTAVRSLGAQNSLAIAEVEGQRFLIGVSRNGVTCIGRLGPGAE